MDSKETFLLMKGWEALGGGDHGEAFVCISCDRLPTRVRHNRTFLNMKVAEYWPMCKEHAFVAQTGFDGGVWRQWMYYSGKSW